MKILLINPKNINGANYTIMPNLGLGYLASALLKDGNDVSILDCIEKNYNCNELSNYLRNKNFDLVGISVSTTTLNSTVEYVKIIKSQIKDAIIVIGGPHPIVEPITTLRSLRNVNFGFCGEGEAGFPRLVNIIEKNRCASKDALKGVQNLIWRNNGDIICNPRETIEDLDSLPYPAWELIEPHKYPAAPVGIFSKERKIAPIITARGCPYPCTFCAVGTVSGKQIRRRSIENVIDEIRLLKERFGIKEIHIMDTNFVADRGFAMEFCNRLIDNRININWACPEGVRIDDLDGELLKLMEHSGCYSLAVGIEAGTQKILDSMKKGLTIQEVREKITLIKRLTKLRITGFFIIGYPGETASDMNKTIKLALDLKIDRANFFNFTPFPGSQIYEELKEKGELNNINCDELYIHNIAYCSKAMTRGELSAIQRKAHIKFYLRFKVLFRIVKEIKSLSQLKVVLQRCTKILLS